MLSMAELWHSLECKCITNPECSWVWTGKPCRLTYSIFQQHEQFIPKYRSCRTLDHQSTTNINIKVNNYITGNQRWTLMTVSHFHAFTPTTRSQTGNAKPFKRVQYRRRARKKNSAKSRLFKIGKEWGGGSEADGTSNTWSEPNNKVSKHQRYPNI